MEMRPSVDSSEPESNRQCAGLQSSMGRRRSSSGMMWRSTHPTRKKPSGHSLQRPSCWVPQQQGHTSSRCDGWHEVCFLKRTSLRRSGTAALQLCFQIFCCVGQKVDRVRYYAGGS